MPLARLFFALNIERLDVFRDFVSETRDEIGAHGMLDVTGGAIRFRAHRIRTEIGFEVMLRKKIKTAGPPRAMRPYPSEIPGQVR